MMGAWRGVAAGGGGGLVDEVQGAYPPEDAWVPVVVL
jgi:hypothetical protein